MQYLNSTLKAVDSAIDKWVKVANGEPERGQTDCKLCKKFILEFDEKKLSCTGCPIRNIAKDTFCRNTPYSNWKIHTDLVGVYKESNPDRIARTIAAQEAAAAMVRFLVDEVKPHVEKNLMKGGN